MRGEGERRGGTVEVRGGGREGDDSRQTAGLMQWAGSHDRRFTALGDQQRSLTSEHAR